MKTWFDKDKQKWVTEIPRAYWIGVCDYITGEKIYSDEGYYWSKRGGDWEYQSKLTSNAKQFYEKYKYYPHTFSRNGYLFKTNKTIKQKSMS